MSDRIVKSTSLPMPNLADQRRIAAILDHADALRAKRRKTITELAQLELAVYEQMFSHSTAQRERFVSGVVADIVEGFESGKNIVADENAGSTFRVLKVSAVTSLRYNEAESKPLPSGYSPPENHVVRSGDLLFSRANTSELVGATAYVHSTDGRTCLPDKLWRFRWHAPQRVAPRYVEKLFQSADFRRMVSERATGSSGSMKNISREKLLSIPIDIPELELQEQFAEFIDNLDVVRSAYEASVAELDSLFSSLQCRAFNGEL